MENAAAVFVHGGCNGEEFVFLCSSAGNKFATFAAVNRCAAGAEAEGAGGHCFVDCLRHLCDVVGGGCFVGGATIAHYVGAQWTVGDLCADVDDALLCSESVEVFGE